MTRLAIWRSSCTSPGEDIKICTGLMSCLYITLNSMITIKQQGRLTKQQDGRPKPKSRTATMRFNSPQKWANCRPAVPVNKL